ncbi:unnamed protein product [Schistocephalus solidus]|uniref:Uncharacterized protein n=1 Tax=Schistocephalus solidus TaxID=70667 RepID=A0A183TE14_SCHSO|nr:unnamed protein product [Schistocephalus solidus]
MNWPIGLPNLPVTVKNRWYQMRPTVQSTALDILDRSRHQHQNWFDDNDAAFNALLAEKNRLHKAYVDRPTASNKAAFYRSRWLVQQWLREMQDTWMNRKAEELQLFVDRNEWKQSFAAVQEPLLFSVLMELAETTQIQKHWAEHFRCVLNRPFKISNAAIDRLPESETNANLDLLPYL